MPQTSLYIHIPFCRGKCPYCGFYSKPIGKFDTARYVSAVITEIKSAQLCCDQVRTIYIGGGTPTILPQEQLQTLLDYLSANFTAVEEFTIETNPAINLNPIFSSGINRVSVGVQSFINDELKMLGRGYVCDDVYAAVETLGQNGIDNISIDLMFALPESSINNWRYSLEQAIALPVKHISAYSLSFDEGTHFSKLLSQGRIAAAGEQTDRDMYIAAIDTLANAGFEQYEISNFAKPGFECRHNLAYWNNSDYIGIGASAGSFHDFTRSENIADINGYIDAMENGRSVKQYSRQISGREYACETAILMLRKREGIDIEQFQKQTGFDLTFTFAAEIDDNVKKGMLEIKAGRLRLTSDALPIADNILCDFAF